MRKTKIVCTLGPASADEKVMEAMLRAGMNVARFNFSHGTHESHREMMQRFRAVRDRLGVAAAVMLDTKGPEIRLKDMAGGEAMLADGAEFTLTARDVQGDAAQVSTLLRPSGKQGRVTLLEGEDTEALENALQELETTGVTLEIDLPKTHGTGEAAARLRQEELLAAEGLDPGHLGENDPLRLYLEELAGVPAFGDEAALAAQCADNGGGEEQLANLGLSRVIELAQEYVGYGVLLMDLIQEGSLGLWQAIQSYCEGPYADHRDRWIRFYLARAVILQAHAGGIGQKMRRAMEDYRQIDERLLAELGRNPTLEEIAEQLHMSPEETEAVKKMIDNARLVDRVNRPEEPEDTQEEAQAVEDTALFQMRQRQNSAEYIRRGEKIWKHGKERSAACTALQRKK